MAEPYFALQAEPLQLASVRLNWSHMSGPQPSIAQCLTLALLIHVLLVLVFGNTPGGSAKPGEGVWGALNIRLAGGDAAGQPEATAAAEAYTGPEGRATQQRWGGAVRAPENLPQAHQDIGAARLGRWQDRAADSGLPAGDAAGASLAPVPTPSPKPEVPTGPVPSPTPAAAAEPEPAAAAVPMLDPAPMVVPAAMAPPMPMPATLPAQLPEAGPAAPSPAASPTPPRILPIAAPPQPIQALSAPALQGAPVEAVPLPTFATQAVTAPSVPGRAPPPMADLAAPAPARAPRPSLNPITAVAPQRTAVPAARETPAGPAADSALPTEAGADTPLMAGARDAGARLGQDVATPPSLPASAPRLNLELVRPRGGAISAQRSRGLLQMLPHPPEDNGKLANDIAKAAKADCRKAYGSLGLAAVVPLALDALREKGCRW